MARFYVPADQIDEEKGQVYLTGADVNHFKNVLRARKGDKCEIVSDDGRRFRCAVIDFSADRILMSIESRSKGSLEPEIKITLIQGVPKGEKTEFVIQKAVELGAVEIIPAMCERTVVRFQTEKDMDKKAARWQKVAEEAAKQCGRDMIPKVERPVELSKIDFAGRYFGYAKIMPYENETERTLRSAINDPDVRAKCISDGLMIFIGPEGGISRAEYDFMTSHGFISVTLGKRILRTETASIFALSAARYEFED